MYWKNGQCCCNTLIYNYLFIFVGLSLKMVVKNSYSFFSFSSLNVILWWGDGPCCAMAWRCASVG